MHETTSGLKMNDGLKLEAMDELSSKGAEQLLGGDY